MGAHVERLLSCFQVASHPPGAQVLTYVLEAQGDGSAGSPFRLSRDGVEIVRDAAFGLAVDQLLSEATQTGIDALGAGTLGLHAGAASFRGAAVLLPAASGSGKTTLVAGLVAAGYDYLSDELALIDAGSAWVRPFPRPLWMTPASVELFDDLRLKLPSALDFAHRHKCQVHPDDLRPRALGRACPVRRVVFPHYLPGAPTTLEALPRSEAVVAMISNAFNMASLGRNGLLALASLARGAASYRLRSGDLLQAVAAVRSVVESS